MGITGWMKEGEDGMRSVEAREEKERQNRMKFTLRFTIKPSETAMVTFIEDPFFSYNEHAVEHGNRTETLVCIQDTRDENDKRIDCPLCLANKRLYAVTPISLINHSENIGKDGKVYKNRKQYAPFKGKVRDLILKLSKEHGGLKYLQFETTRGLDQKSYNVGEFWKVMNNGKRIDPKTIMKLAPPNEDPAKWIEPFNYEELVTPMDAAALYEILGISRVMGSEKDVDNEAGRPETKNTSTNTF